MRRIGLLAVLLVLVLGACAQDAEDTVRQDEPDEAAAQTIAVEASDYKFEAPARVSSGAVEITLTNSGKEPHQAQLFRLNDGVEIAQLVDSAKEDSSGGGLLELGTYEGGPNAVDGGEEQIATAGLQAGRYAFVCLVPDAQGRAHLGLGMAKALEVEQADDEVDVPEADQASSADEYSFQLPEEWSGTIAFDNKGEQPHELQVIGVAEGKTPEDVEAWFKAEPGEAGPPSWTTGGGAAVVAPGETTVFETDLEPATYYAMCFVLDPERKAPHFALGMMQKFDVKG